MMRGLIDDIREMEENIHKASDMLGQKPHSSTLNLLPSTPQPTILYPQPLKARDTLDETLASLWNSTQITKIRTQP